MVSATILMIFALLIFILGSMIFPISDVATIDLHYVNIRPVLWIELDE